MSIPTIFHIFQDIHADAGKITAERLNTNWSRLYDMFDPTKVGISEDNIKSPSKILMADKNYTGLNKITGSYEFSACPVIPDASITEAKINVVDLVKKVAGKIPDTDINTNIPRKENAETISGSWTFNNSIKNLIAEHKDTLPDPVVNGQIIEYAGDIYIGKSGAWKKLSYESELPSIATVSSVPAGTARFHGNTPVVDNGTPPQKKAEIKVNNNMGKLRITYGGTSGASMTLYLDLALNGTVKDSLVIENSVDPITKTYDFTVDLNANDLIQLYAYKDGTGACQITVFDIGYALAIKNISTHTLQSLLPIVWEEGLAYSFTNTL